MRSRSCSEDALYDDSSAMECRADDWASMAAASGMWAVVVRLLAHLCTDGMLARRESVTLRHAATAVAAMSHAPLWVRRISRCVYAASSCADAVFPPKSATLQDTGEQGDGLEQLLKGTHKGEGSGRRDGITSLCVPCPAQRCHATGDGNDPQPLYRQCTFRRCRATPADESLVDAKMKMAE